MSSSVQLSLYKEWNHKQQGLFFEKGNNLLPGSPVEYIEACAAIESVFNESKLFTQLTELLSNHQTWVLQKDASTLLKADIIRTVPLYYGETKNGYFVTDNLERYQQEFGDLELDESKFDEYLLSCYVFGQHTLYKNVFVIQSGEVVEISEKGIRTKRYFSYLPTAEKKTFSSPEDFALSFEKIMSSTMQRMLQSAPAVNRWVLPLSGGHDSRMLANFLYKAGVKNVVCFSYGTDGNMQSGISKRVAEALGYEWHFVLYTEDKWQQMHEQGIFDEYLDFAGMGSSSPHLQDLLAIHELKKNGVLKEGDIIVPGHALDFAAGSHLTEYDITPGNKTTYLKKVFEKFAPKSKGDTGGHAYASFETVYKGADCDLDQFQEYFNWQERQTKNIVNSIRIYEFFGFDVRLPYWDKLMIDFWLGLAPQCRIKRHLLLAAERKGLLIEQLSAIEFDDETGSKKEPVVKAMLSKIFPSSLKIFLLRLLKRKQTLNEGLNQVFAQRAGTVREMLEPLKDYPAAAAKVFNEYLGRYPFQMDYDFLINLYCTRRILTKNKAKR